MSTLIVRKITGESKMKCRQCRSIVIEECGSIVVNGHGNKLFEEGNEVSNSCGAKDSVWYLDDDQSPSWIKERVEEGEWTKGRLNCPKCGARIGSFDFTSGVRCNCSECVLPGIRLIKTKVDV